MSGVLCSRHQAELYPDSHDGEPMKRWLCPEPGCTSILADAQLESMKDQAWASEHGMLAPGWHTLGEART